MCSKIILAFSFCAEGLRDYQDLEASFKAKCCIDSMELETD